MAEFASNGKGNAALTTGIIGTSLGGLLALGNGLLGGLGRSACCNEDHFVNRYEMEKEKEIATLQMENSILKSDKYTDEKSIEMYKYVDGSSENLNRQSHSRRFIMLPIHLQSLVSRIRWLVCRLLQRL